MGSNVGWMDGLEDAASDLAVFPTWLLLRYSRLSVLLSLIKKTHPRIGWMSPYEVNLELMLQYNTAGQGFRISKCRKP